MKIKIVSWNIWIDGHFDDIASFLRGANADIIGLQEVKDDDATRDVIGYLEMLGYASVFAPVKKVWKDKVFNDGPAIFSKFPIVASEIYLLSQEHSRAAIRADIAIGSVTVSVFSTHLVHTHQQPSDIQNIQAEKLLYIAPRERTIIMGDFNATPSSAPIQKMKEVFSDTDAASTPTWSVYPAGCTVCNPQSLDTRLDYIFASNDLHTNSFKVESSKGSDHLPISVMVEL